MESKSLVIFLAILFTSTKTCDGQFLDIIKGVGVTIKVMAKAYNILEPYINPENKTDEVVQHELLNGKLDGISLQIQQTEKGITKTFKDVLQEVTKHTNDTVAADIARELETCVIDMEKELGEIVDITKKVKKGTFSKDEYILNMLKRHSDRVNEFRTIIKGIVQKKSFSMDFLTHVKNEATNVCVSRMSQLQELDSFRALYVDTMMKYLISEHLIISMYELLGIPDKNNDKKIFLNEQVQKDFNNDLSRFQEILGDASQEFQTCNKPSVIHPAGAKYVESKSCYVIDKNNKMQPSTGLITSLNVPKTVCWYYFSRRPAKAKPGYVVLGAKIEKNSNILYIRVIQGKLLANGLIDPKSVSYNDDPGHEVGDSVVKIYFKDTVIDLTETIISKNRVITGLRFNQSDKGHVYLEVISTKINVKQGILYEETTRPEQHKDGITPYSVRKIEARNDTVARSPTGLLPIKPDQHVKLAFYLGKGGHPYIDGDAIFPTPLTLLSGASLYVKEVKGELGFLSLRFHTFNIAPHTKIELDVNQNFSDIFDKI